MENIFRAYDIRGIIGKEINEKSVEKIGKAFGTILNGKGVVVVARDTRKNGDKFKKSLIKGLTSTGISVLDIGLQCTPVLNFYCKHVRAVAGAQITASHNPPEYSGIRFRKGNGVGFPECIQKVKELFFSEEFLKTNVRGKVTKINEETPQKAYIDYILKKIKIYNRVSVVLDPGNGAASGFAKQLFETAGCKTISINDNPDENFSGRGPDPKPKMLLDLGQEVRINNADLGIAFDGDGDRVVIVDEEGEPLSADETGSIIIKEILKERKGNVAINIECSKAVEEVINENGGNAIYIRVGDAFLANAVSEYNAIFAMENSDHFLIPKYFPADDGIMTGLFFTKIISESQKPLSELRKEIPKYPREKIKISCADELKFKVIRNIKKKISYYKIIEIDGIRINFNKAWVLIRASNTTPFIRITAEAESKTEVENIINKFKTIVEEEIKKVNG